MASISNTLINFIVRTSSSLMDLNWLYYKNSWSHLAVKWWNQRLLMMPMMLMFVKNCKRIQKKPIWFKNLKWVKVMRETQKKKGGENSWQKSKPKMVPNNFKKMSRVISLNKSHRYSKRYCHIQRKSFSMTMGTTCFRACSGLVTALSGLPSSIRSRPKSLIWSARSRVPSSSSFLSLCWPVLISLRK